MHLASYRFSVLRKRMLIVWVVTACSLFAGATNTYWKVLVVQPEQFDDPYRIALFSPIGDEDPARLWSQTKSLFVYGIGMVGFLAALPEDFTGWDTDEDIFHKWKENIRKGPVWDRDKWYIDYIGHPYFGGVYYQVARKSGYRQWDAFVYSFLMSTFYWEYGVEALAETPSIQDLVVHPVLGWVYGEWAYQTEYRIRCSGNRVAGSKAIGGIVLFVLDPTDALACGVNRISGHRLIESGFGYFTVMPEADGNPTVYLSMEFPLGPDGPAGDPPERTFDVSYDPVDTGIVGLSAGTHYMFFNKALALEDDLFSKATLGLYFSPRLGTCLSYAWGNVTQRGTGKTMLFENYSLDTQLYLCTRRVLRPYVSAGFGERMLDKNRDTKEFLWNAGAGLHCQLHPKWAVQTEWMHYFGSDGDEYNQALNASLVYRFGRGEHRGW